MTSSVLDAPADLTVTTLAPAPPERAPLPFKVEVNEDGSLHYSGEHVLVTGPITGTVTLADGSVVNVSPAVIPVNSPEHALEIAHHIGVRFEEEGNHPSHQPTLADPFPAPFVHLCTDATCGAVARPVSHPMQAMALTRAQQLTDGILDAETRAHFAAAHGTDPRDSLSSALASAAAENAALNGLDGTGSTNVIPDVSLHTASPSTTGANETANTGSYARQACTNNAASAGAKTNSTSLTFSTLGTVAVTHIGTWSSAVYAGGTYAIGAALGSSVTAASITIASAAISWTAT